MNGCTITVFTKDGYYKSIYSCLNKRPGLCIRLLTKHYPSQALAEKLVDTGRDTGLCLEYAGRMIQLVDTGRGTEMTIANSWQEAMIANSWREAAMPHPVNLPLHYLWTGEKWIVYKDAAYEDAITAKERKKNDKEHNHG